MRSIADGLITLAASIVWATGAFLYVARDQNEIRIMAFRRGGPATVWHPFRMQKR
jgi:hypothetical protein